MSLWAAFLDGQVGVSLDLPDTLELLEETDSDAFLADNVAGQVWSLSVSPAPLRLEPGRPARIRAATRHSFEARAKHAAPGESSRARDPAWSPVIQHQLLDLPSDTGPRPAMLTVVREAYAPGDELVAAYVLVPVEGGTAQISIAARSDQTGLREAALLERVLLARGGTGRPATHLLGALPQSELDDPRHDPLFLTHPLSRVRAGLAVLLPTLRATGTLPAVRAQLVLPGGPSLDLPAGYAPVPLVVPEHTPAGLHVQSAVYLAHRLATSTTITLVRRPERLPYFFSDRALRQHVLGDATTSGQTGLTLQTVPGGLLVRSQDAAGPRFTRWFADKDRYIYALILHSGWLTEDEAIDELDTLIG